MEFKDLAVFIIALAIVLAGGVVVIKEILGGKDNEKGSNSEQ